MPRGFLFDIRGRDGLSAIARTAGDSLSGLGQVGLRAVATLGRGALGAAGQFATMGVAIVGVAAGIRAAVIAGTEYGRSLNDLSTQTGESVRSLARYQFTAAQTDQTVTELRRTLEETGQTLAEYQRDAGISPAIIESYADLAEGAAEVADVIDDLARRRDTAKGAIAASFAEQFGGSLNPFRRLGTGFLEGAAESRIPLEDRARAGNVRFGRDRRDPASADYTGESPYGPGGEFYGQALSARYARERAQILNANRRTSPSGQVTYNVNINAGVLADQERVRDYVLGTIRNALEDNEIRIGRRN